MAPTKKEKTKTDLEEAVFKFSDKKEELEELLGDPPDEHGVPNAGLVKSILLELSDEWETVRSSFMNFVKIREEEEDGTAVEEWTTKYKHWRKRFVEVRGRVGKFMDQQVANTRQQHVEVVDHSGQVETALQAATFTRLRLEDEVCMVVENIAKLPSELSSETVSNHRVKPDQLSNRMEDRLMPHLQRQVELEPQRREELESSHRVFLKTQFAKLDAALNMLFGKQAKPEPGASSTSSTSDARVRGPPRLQLEKLKVPTFDGDHTKWLLFKSKFE